MRKWTILATLALALGLAGSAQAAPGSGGDIVGGGSTTIEEWPWQVALADPPAAGGNGFQRQFCGATLVSRTAVLTAAHCVYTGGFADPSTLSAITGRTFLSSSAGAEISITDVIYFVDSGGTATPQSVLSPPAGAQLYDEDSSEWDVAVLELASPAPAPATPVSIASAAERNLWEPGDAVFATGWGDTTGAGTYPDELQEVELEVISDADCGDGTSYGAGFVPSVMVCAGVPITGGKDTCQGDSGGPLVAPAGDGSFRLIGDTSFGIGCALPDKPGVYGRLADSAMRPALLSAIGLADGTPVSPGPTSAVDLLAPQTTFAKTPRKRTTKRVARFAWTATESASFECRVDGRPPSRCSSPFSKRVKPGRRHTLTVQATDAAGNEENPPAAFSWKVRRR